MGATAVLALLIGGSIVAAAPVQARVVIGFGFGPVWGYPYAYYPYPSYYAYPAYPYYAYPPSYAYYGYPYYRPPVHHHHHYHHAKTTKSSACHPAPRTCS